MSVNSRFMARNRRSGSHSNPPKGNGSLQMFWWMCNDTTSLWAQEPSTAFHKMQCHCHQCVTSQIYSYHFFPVRLIYSEASLQVQHLLRPGSCGFKNLDGLSHHYSNDWRPQGKFYKSIKVYFWELRHFHLLLSQPVYEKAGIHKVI